MPILEPDILRTKHLYMKVQLMDILVLMMNIQLAAKDLEIGFEDANHTLNTLTKYLNRPANVNISSVESGLWSANLLNEKKMFWHPQDIPFETFVQRLAPKLKFNKDYNFFQETGDFRDR